MWRISSHAAFLSFNFLFAPVLSFCLHATGFFKLFSVLNKSPVCDLCLVDLVSQPVVISLTGVCHRAEVFYFDKDNFIMFMDCIVGNKSEKCLQNTMP